MVLNCGAKPVHEKFSYEENLKQGEAALQDERIFEAEEWAKEALKVDPHGLEAQKLMAKVYDYQITEERADARYQAPEELKLDEKSLRVKTLLDRSRSLMEMNLLKEANDTAEEAFQLDPENLEASRLLDSIKEKAQKQGRQESLFLQGLYEEEATSRVERYSEQTRQAVKEKRWGTARLMVEKILLLDPRNSEAKKWLTEIEKNDEGSPASLLRETVDSE